MSEEKKEEKRKRDLMASANGIGKGQMKQSAAEEGFRSGSEVTHKL